MKVFETFSSRKASHVRKLSSGTQIVGRETERMLLSEILQSINDSASRVVVVEGEAGLGNRPGQ